MRAKLKSRCACRQAPHSLARLHHRCCHQLHCKHSAGHSLLLHHLSIALILQGCKKAGLAVEKVDFVQSSFLGTPNNNCSMPRRTSFGNDEGNEPHRSLRASHQQLNNTGELVSVSSGTAQREATSAASAVAPVSSSSLRQRDVAASGNAATAAPDSSQQRQQQVLDCTSNVTMDTRKRAPSNGDVPSRKKSRSTRISLNNDDKDEESSNDAREQSPNVKLKYPSTITPVCNESTRARMDQQDENASSTAVTNANLLRSNNNDAGDESSTTSTTGSSVLTTDVPVLPEGVVDLYSSDSCKTATCQQHCTATQALTAAFLSTYGHEYYQNLKDQEHHDDASSSSCTSSTASPSHGTTHRSHAVVPAAVKPVLGTGPLVGDLETIPCQPHLTEKMRAILMDWLVELVEEYKLSPQTLHLAVTLVDQSFARGAPTLSSEGSDFFTIQREMLQCVGW